MKIIIVSSDVLANCGLNLIVANSIKKAHSSCFDSLHVDFEYYSSLDEFINIRDSLDDILCLVHYFQLNSNDSNLFVKYVESIDNDYPVILYTSDSIPDFFVQYLYSSGVHAVLTKNDIENDICSLLQNFLCNRLKKIGYCNQYDKNSQLNNISDPRNVFDNSYQLDVQSISAYYSNTIPYTSIDYTTHILPPNHIEPIPKTQLPSLIYDFKKLNCSLSPRKKKLIECLILGLSNKEIAEISNLSTGTVRNYIHQLCVNYDVKNRTELAIKIRDLIMS